MLQPTQTRITAEDYYRLPEYEQHDLIQLINGEVMMGMPPIPKHQSLVGEILFLFMTIARQKRGETFILPIEVYLDEHNIFEPDVLYLTPDTQCVVEEKRLRGAPELVVEVLSPGAAKVARQEKQQAYEKHGVREYWIVDPVYEVIEVLNLENQRYERQGVYALDDTFESHVLGETVNIKSIFNT